jgi:hypothetical protein
VQVFHQEDCSVAKWRDLSAAIYCYPVLFQVLCNVRWDWWLLLVVRFLCFLCVFALGVCLGFVVGFVFESAFVFLGFGCVLFFTSVSWSVKARRNIGLDSFGVVLLDELMVNFLQFLPWTTILERHRFVLVKQNVRLHERGVRNGLIEPDSFIWIHFRGEIAKAHAFNRLGDGCDFSDQLWVVIVYWVQDVFMDVEKFVVLLAEGCVGFWTAIEDFFAFVFDLFVFLNSFWRTDWRSFAQKEGFIWNKKFLDHVLELFHVFKNVAALLCFGLHFFNFGAVKCVVLVDDFAWFFRNFLF